jgi:hypothetical protein
MEQTPGRNYPYPTVADEADVPNNLEQLALALDRDISLLTYDTGWIDVDFVNNFTSGFEGSRMRRKADVVYYQVMAISPGGTAAWASETVLFRFPPGMRPGKTHWAIANNEGLTVEVRLMSNGDARAITPSRPERGGVLVFSGSFPLDI